MQHWTEELAGKLRKELGLTSFVRVNDADRLLDYATANGVEYREDPDTDCLGEIRPFRGRWFLKLSARLEPSLRADVIIHEIAHRYTRSGMAAICSPAFDWWWLRRDEISASLWCAHYRLPTEQLLELLRKEPPWDDLVLECSAPEGLLALKLKTLGSPLYRKPTPPNVQVDSLPLLASQALRVETVPENGWQWRIQVVNRSTGERWVWKRAQHQNRLTLASEELNWDLVAWSERRFWSRWRERLEPLDEKTHRLRWSNPKPFKG